MIRDIHQHELSYVLLRAALGLNILMHGLTRLFGTYGLFVRNTERAFEDTILPALAVKVFAAALPPVETLLGAFILLGFYTRISLCSGAVLMLFLIFGKCLQQDWTTVSLQMIYILFYYILIDRLADNRVSIDARKKKRLIDVEV